MLLENFLRPVFNQAAFYTIIKAIDSANIDNQLELVTGGTYNGSKGLFIDPTIYVFKTPDHPLLERELFGPVLLALVYPDADFDNVLEIIDRQWGGLRSPGSNILKRSRCDSKGREATSLGSRQFLRHLQDCRNCCSIVL